MTPHKRKAGRHAVHAFARASILTGLGVMVLMIIISTTYYSRQPAWPTIQMHHETTAQRLAPIGSVYIGDAGRAALKKAQAGAEASGK